MRLGILADTHDRVERTRAAVGVLRAAGALVHCGDLASPPVVAACAVLPFTFAFGNHDADAVPALRRTAADYGAVCLGWGGVAHGHLAADLRRVLADRPDYLLSGHSHLPSDTVEGAVRRINPGALHRAEEFTVALLDLATGELRFLPVPR